MAGSKEDPVLGIDGLLIKEEPLINTKPVKDNKVREEGVPSDKEMAPAGSIHRSGSRPQLDLSKAAIQGNFEEKDPTILLPNQSDDISHLAVDLGGMILNYAFGLSYY